MEEHFIKKETCAQRQDDGKIYNSICLEPTSWEGVRWKNKAGKVDSSQTLKVH